MPSPYWAFFEKCIEEDGKSYSAICKLIVREKTLHTENSDQPCCSARIAVKGGTTSGLKKHLIAVHGFNTAIEMNVLSLSLILHSFLIHCSLILPSFLIHCSFILHFFLIHCSLILPSFLTYHSFSTLFFSLLSY